MARPQAVTDQDLIDRLSAVFSDVGYAGASLTDLARAAGLGKASLYHRFPGGKRQMAEEVLADAGQWLDAHVLAPLTGEGPVRARLAEALQALDGFYHGGRRACLLNMLSSPRNEDGPFAPAVKAAIQSLIAAFAATARDAGLAADEAGRRAQRAVMLLQGSLVLSRGLGSSAPFVACLAALPDDLLGQGGVS